jgi:hypothetical protein
MGPISANRFALVKNFIHILLLLPELFLKFRNDCHRLWSNNQATLEPLDIACRFFDKIVINSSFFKTRRVIFWPLLLYCAFYCQIDSLFVIKLLGFLKLWICISIYLCFFVFPHSSMTVICVGYIYGFADWLHG